MAFGRKFVPWSPGIASAPSLKPILVRSQTIVSSGPRKEPSGETLLRDGCEADVVYKVRITPLKMRFLWKIKFRTNY